MPATLFIVPGAIGCQCGYWWDELARLVLLPDELPPSVNLDVDGHQMSWHLGAAARMPREIRERHRAWVAWSGDPPTARHALYAELWETLQPLCHAAREAVLDQLRTLAEGPWFDADADRIVDEQELRTLAAHPLVTIGAHTVSHPQLSVIALPEQRSEIGESKRMLEALLEQPVDQFAYPFGGPEDYGEATPLLVQEAGYALACTTRSGQVRRRTNPYELPRCYVQDWDGAEFARRLSAWLDG
jgi:peptidoglycan/xylan/chitin deacetylase (PgdA/CDA1 family)